MAAAQLALNPVLPTETAGSRQLSAPERSVEWVRKLYEKGVAGFYDVALSPQGWKVEAGRTLHWQLADGTDGINAIFPSMQADIVLSHAGLGRRIVVDTKFNKILGKGWHKDATLRSGYIYQIYAYLRSQERAGDALAERASGLLLHPCVGSAVEEQVTVQGHRLRFATVDLGASAGDIRGRLLEVAETLY